MVELTALRKEIGEVRAVTSELRDARTELTNARVSLGEVVQRVAGAEGAKATIRAKGIGARVVRR